MSNENTAVAEPNVENPDVDVVTADTAPEPKSDSKPVEFIRTCVGQSTTGQNTLSPIGRLANVVANAKGEKAADFREALRFLADGGIDQRLPGGNTLRDFLTTGANTYKAEALLGVKGVAD